VLCWHAVLRRKEKKVKIVQKSNASVEEFWVNKEEESFVIKV
jgi:hypothetical protein